MGMEEAVRPLKELKPEHGFFVGIDSDGCAFDTMEIKQKECFIPNIIIHWGLQAVSKYAREAVEFVNLYSRWRGINRFPALVRAFDLLRDREDVQRRNVDIPQVPKIREFIDSGVPLGNPSLKQVVEDTSDPELVRTLAWSEAVNRTIADMVKGAVNEALKKAKESADQAMGGALGGMGLPPGLF